MKKIVYFSALIQLLTCSTTMAQSMDRYRSEFYILRSDYLIDTSRFVRTFENDDFYVMQKKSDLENFELTVGKMSFQDSLKVFFVSIEDSVDENNIYIYTHHSWCRFENDQYEISSGFGVFPHFAIAEVWRTVEGYFYVKYIEVIEPDVNHTIEFVIRDKNEDGWWYGKKY